MLMIVYEAINLACSNQLLIKTFRNIKVMSHRLQILSAKYQEIFCSTRIKTSVDMIDKLCLDLEAYLKRDFWVFINFKTDCVKNQTTI
ncbi:hypothetical protein KUTeg_012691 [Tegillarca granosa]|uniref:Uncharacterized protein n=1 Tax=Tegillarca granosa TaxID=220873 RepID=A0ABQ9F3R1_TEGGR|nr:hypothetical protein KUTeg_012691 [Tegillarca granosa]